MADQSEKVAAAALAISAAGLLLYRRYASSSATPKASSALKAKIALYGQNAAADSDGSAWLDVLAKAANVPLDSQDFAAQMDAADPLRHIRPSSTFRRSMPRTVAHVLGGWQQQQQE